MQYAIFYIIQYPNFRLQTGYIGTVICMVCGGPIIDFFTWLLHLILPDNIHIFGRVLMLVLGCVILAYGMTIVIKSDAGTGPNDLVAVVISDKLQRKFSITRLLVDGAFAVIGFFLGGTGWCRNHRVYSPGRSCSRYIPAD